MHNWIVVPISESPARRGGERGGLDLLQKSERPFVLHNSGIRRTEEKASSRNDWDCHSTRTGSPLLASSSHGPHSFFYDAQEKHAEQWRRGLILVGDWRDGRAEGNRVKESAAAIR